MILIAYPSSVALFGALMGPQTLVVVASPAQMVVLAILFSLSVKSRPVVGPFITFLPLLAFPRLSFSGLSFGRLATRFSIAFAIAFATIFSFVVVFAPFLVVLATIFPLSTFAFLPGLWRLGIPLSLWPLSLVPVAHLVSRESSTCPLLLATRGVSEVATILLLCAMEGC